MLATDILLDYAFGDLQVDLSLLWHSLTLPRYSQPLLLINVVNL